MSIIVLFFLIVESSSSSVVCTTTPAQSPTVPATVANRTSLSISLLIFLFALFLTAFLSIYVSYCFHHQHHQLPQTTTSPTRGIDPRVLATFPVMSYSPVKIQNAAFQCAVCLAEFDDGDALRLLPRCGHVFHPACIDAWLAAHVTCPICRGEVTVKIEDRHDSKSVIEGEGEARARHVFEKNCTVKGFGLLLRSHSTGHSLESFTLRLPEEMMKKLLQESERASVMTRMKRSVSYDVVLRSVEVVEGNSYNRWVLSVTPPFVSRGSDLSNVGTACSGIPRFWGA